MYEALDQPRKLGHLLIAIDPKRFAGAGTMEATAEMMIAELRGMGDILFPGEPEILEDERRRADGIPVEPAALADMNAWSGKLGLQPLTPARAA
jgi:LDH2 family malate/lactate/ureidoglycolate dehydrogenase